ncbi:hypothetical protein DV735_g4656, partial [Chaetothyriales sp. CBS 134920]
MERKHRPPPLPASPFMPQPTVDLNNGVVTARLPSGDSVTIYLYGATVTSWKTSSGKEQLFVSSAVVLDGSKSIRGGIPLVFPNFGPPIKDHATGGLRQHGFARNAAWEFLGKSSSESAGDDSVKLDFGLGPSGLAEPIRANWDYNFGLVYSVTLSKNKLHLSLLVKNEGTKPFEFHALFHTYLALKDISQTTVHGLRNTQYVDRLLGDKTFQEEHDELPITAETDRVYTLPVATSENNDAALVVKEAGSPSFVVTSESLPNVTVWNGWIDKIKGMRDFEPKDGYKRYLCLEPGSVLKWNKLEGGEVWSGSTTYEAKL